MKLFFSTLALALAPVAAFAVGCSDHRDKAMSCAAGTVYDAATSTCVSTNS